MEINKRYLVNDDSGLTITEAQSISNMMNQRLLEIGRKIDVLNNYSSKVSINGEAYILRKAEPVNNDIIDLIIEKGKLSGAISFLMEHIKLKNTLLENNKNSQYKMDTSTAPERPEMAVATSETLVDEQWGWSKLSNTEWSDFLFHNANAAHIGLFIHQRGKLDLLRTELPTLKEVDFMSIEDGKKTPYRNEIHHTSEGLLALHEKLAASHRESEQKVNYYKAKVKNLVLEENVIISKRNKQYSDDTATHNEKLMREFNEKYTSWRDAEESKRLAFINQAFDERKKLVSLRIAVTDPFGEVINIYREKLVK